MVEGRAEGEAWGGGRHARASRWARERGRVKGRPVGVGVVAGVGRVGWWQDLGEGRQGS